MQLIFSAEFRSVLFRSVLFRASELDLPRNSECLGMHTFFRGIAETESIPRNFFGTKFRSQPYLWCIWTYAHQEPLLLLNVYIRGLSCTRTFTLQDPVLLLDLSTEACTAHGRVYTKGAGDALFYTTETFAASDSGRVYTS